MPPRAQPMNSADLIRTSVGFFRGLPLGIYPSLSQLPAALRLIIHMPMRPRRPITAIALLALSCALLAAPTRAQSARELRERAADLTYNLDHDEAIRLLRQAVAAEPNDSVNHRALASTIWLNILFKRGAVTVDHYIGSFTKANVDMRNPPTDLDAEFKKE